MKKLTVSILFIAITSLFIINCTDKGPNFYGENVTVVSEDGPVPDRVFLDQNWDQQTREDFWWTSQGAEIIPYRWFVWLEMPNSESLFRSSSHMEQLRYLPFQSSQMNPGGLPIGFTISKALKGKEHWVGLTCAACHANQLDYKGTKMLIEGAPTLANFSLFFNELVASLNATNKDDAKFERFAKNVLGSQYDTASASELRTSLLEVAETTALRQIVNSLDSFPHDMTSYARLDAFGEIQNAGTAFALNAPENDPNNKNIPSAPVSYPFLWGTHQSDVVQWNASARNTPIIGPLVRNVGEVVGVFGKLDITKVGEHQGLLGKGIEYTSTVNMHNLGELEKWVENLRSPAWPEQYLPSIDAIKAAQGEALFRGACISCHTYISRENEGNKYIANKTPLSEIGTDPAMATNAAAHIANMSILTGTKSAILLGPAFPEKAPAIGVPVNGVIGLILKDPVAALEAGMIPYLDEHADGSEPEIVRLIDEVKALIEKHKQTKATSPDLLHQKIAELLGKHLSGGNDQLVYKGRPLNGIWATAPYLHNGSVPNLWELLQSPETRIESFWVGSREFDPVNVGYESDQGLNEFKVRDKKGEIQLGNSNRGHDYGTTWTDEEKWAVIEYMKTL